MTKTFTFHVEYSGEWPTSRTFVIKAHSRAEAKSKLLNHETDPILRIKVKEIIEDIELVSDFDGSGTDMVDGEIVELEEIRPWGHGMPNGDRP